MKYLIAVLILFSIFQSCDDSNHHEVPEAENPVQKLIETDKAFSRLSEEKGMKTAYIDFLDSNGVLLKPGLFPVVGANAIDFLIQQNDTAFILTRRPQSAVVAASGELGYTYGIFSYRLKHGDTSHFGTYVSIWKRQSDGSWKCVLDSGNDGIGEQ